MISMKWVAEMIRKFLEDKNAIKYTNKNGDVLIFDLNEGKTGNSKGYEESSETVKTAVAYADLRNIGFPEDKPEPVFERAERGRFYYSICTNCNELETTYCVECGLESNVRSYDCGNYFLTEEKAQKVADKMNFLLKLEKLHETYCPNFKPDWNSNEGNKCRIFFNHNINAFDYTFEAKYEDLTGVFFSSDEIAEKVCDILNKEYDLPV